MGAYEVVEVLGISGHCMQVLRKLLEVYLARGSRWKYVGVYGNSWKLPPNMVVEAAIDGSNGNFHFNREWQLPSTSMKACTNYHRSRSTPHLLPWKKIYFEFTSMNVSTNFH